MYIHQMAPTDTLAGSRANAIQRYRFQGMINGQ
jgi:hypothetical protein